MRKKDLLAIPQTIPPEVDEFVDKQRSVLGQAQYVALPDGSTIYNIDLYTRFVTDVVLSARYFASPAEENFISYIIEKKKWSSAGIDNIANYVHSGYMDQNGNYYWRNRSIWEYAGDPDDYEVEDFRGTRDIQYWENNIRSNRYYTGLHRRQLRINNMMDEKTPDIPDDFKRWLHEEVFLREYLYQKKLEDKTQMWCTACAKKWTVKKGRKAGRTICPKCGAEVIATYKTEHKSKETQVYLLQKCDDGSGWMERLFRTKAFWEWGKQRRVEYDERIRIIIPPGKDRGKCFYEEGVRRNGEPRYWDKNPYNHRIVPGYLYPYNLDETKDMWTRELQHSGIEVLTSKGIPANFNLMIMHIEHWPYMEYLIKGRFYRLAREIINDSPHKNMNQINQDGKSPKELLSLGQSQVDRLRQMDGGFLMLSWLQAEWEKGVKVSPENMDYLVSRGINARNGSISEALEYLTPNELVNYIRKQMEKARTSFFEGTLHTYCDYLDMARKQKLNLAHPMFYKPKDLKAAHDECVLNGKKREFDLRAEEILEKFPHIQENMDAIRERYSYEGEKFCIRVPRGIPDILREGRSLGHCIDTTDRYFDRINQNISYLLFLRRIEDPEKSYYTLEVEPGGTIRQQRTTGNNQNKEEVEEYMPFIREWQQKLRKRITRADKELAAQSREIRIREYQDLRERKETVWHGKLAGKLLADVLEGDLIENAV